MIRLQKLLANWGIASRRAIEELINEGKITVNGEKVKLGFSVDELNPPEIFICGKKAEKDINSDKKLVYAFNKPKFVVSTVKDDKGRKCVADFFLSDLRLYPIGRLDYESSGLLLITNYGELTNRLLHPSHKVDKEYIVKIDGEPLSLAEENKFKNGIKLEDGITAPAQIHKIKNGNLYSVIIHEGKNRQIRRMFAFLGRNVISLKRISFGPIKLGNLPSGEMRELSRAERKYLLIAAGIV